MSEPVQIADIVLRRRAQSSNGARGTLSECRDLAVKQLGESLAEMFDQVDDALFKLADKSDNNLEQTHYFDAMREVRLKRPAMERRFSDACGQNFSIAADSAHCNAERKGGASRGELGALESPTSLSLIANDDLEESLAIDNLVQKIEAACVEELYALDQRMALLLDLPPSQSGTNPLAPKLLCEAFRDACDDIAAGIEIKLLVLKLFDKFVAADLAEHYQRLNRFLAEKGILPTISRPAPQANAATRVRRHSAGAPGAGGTAVDGVTPAGGAVPPTAGGVSTGGIAPGVGGIASGGVAPAAGHALGAGGGPATFVGGLGFQAGAGGSGNAEVGADNAFANGYSFADTSPQDLLAMLGEVMTSRGASQMTAQASYDANPVATMQALTGLQQVVMGGAGSATVVLDPQQLAAGTTNILRDLKTTTVGNEMGRVDNMMIDIVAMLFDGILDDPAIPQSMKGLIGRLQIPVLKVAILDKTFFSRKFHPARKLLNSLAEVAMGGADEQDDNDPAYRKVDEVVRRILDEFDDDIRIFKQAADELDAFRAEEQRQAESRVEQSLQEIQAQERLRFARQIAGEQIAARIQDKAIPNVVREFLDVYWKSFLQLAYIDEGEESVVWAGGIETMDDLLWSLSPKHTEADRARLKSVLTTLPGRLKDGMARVPIADAFRDRLLGTLIRLHLAAIKPSTTTPTAAGNVVALDSPSEVVDPEAVTAPPHSEADLSAMESLDEASLGLHDSLEALAGVAQYDDADADCSGFFDPTGGETGEPFDVQMPGIEVNHDAEQLLIAAVTRANQKVFETAQQKPECEGMGTTLVAARFQSDRVTMIHVGDSRLYRLRDGIFEQLTSDHSLRQELVDQGFLTAEEAKTSKRKNYVTRAVGIDAAVRPDTREDQVVAGDLYLLCSDGLSDLVEDDDIDAILCRPQQTLAQAAQALVDQANANGGKDNISVVLVRAPDSLATCDGDSGETAWEMVGLSDLGCTRSHNEDCVGFDANTGLAVLADGMGGYNAGEVASALAVEVMMASLGHVSGADVSGSNSEDDIARATDGISVEHHDDGEIVLEGNVYPELDPSAFDEEGLEEIEIHDVDSVLSAQAEDEHLATVRQLEIGNWVEFTNQMSSSVRARLTWISKATGSYLFTNRQGHKVADTTPQGLAVEFRRGTARKLETVPLFDRALSSLMDRLHGDTSDPWTKSGS